MNSLFQVLPSILIGFVLFASAAAPAEIRKLTIEYFDGPTKCVGYLAFDETRQDLRPGVLVVPEWWGLTDYAKSRAEQLAQLGYVAFAVDMYGDGKTTDKPDQAKQLAGPLQSDRMLMRQRAMAGLKTLQAQKYVDNKKLAAIGYCFGGTTVLELARAGVPLAGVVSFHGGLARGENMPSDAIQCRILVCAGGDDPMVPPKQINEFEQEMKNAKASYQINTYSGAVHAFTNPKADSFHIPGIGYNEQADRSSWSAMKTFLDELFK